MEAVFGTVQGLPGSGAGGGALPGLGGTGTTEKAHFVHRDGQRFRTGHGPLGITKHGEADLIIWQAPNGQRMMTHVLVPCPRCGYQRPVSATQMNTQGTPVQVATASEKGLTLLMRLQCPAHWEEVNESGHATGRRQKCGFDGVIRDGAVHSTRCPCANFNAPHAAHNCMCGGLLTPEQQEAREAELHEQRRGL